MFQKPSLFLYQHRHISITTTNYDLIHWISYLESFVFSEVFIRGSQLEGWRQSANFSLRNSPFRCPFAIMIAEQDKFSILSGSELKLGIDRFLRRFPNVMYGYEEHVIPNLYWHYNVPGSVRNVSLSSELGYSIKCVIWLKHLYPIFSRTDRIYLIIPLLLSAKKTKTSAFRNKIASCRQSAFKAHQLVASMSCSTRCNFH